MKDLEQIAELDFNNKTYKYYLYEDEQVFRISSDYDFGFNAYWDIDLLTDDLLNNKINEIVELDKDLIDNLIESLTELDGNDEAIKNNMKLLHNYKEEI